MNKIELVEEVAVEARLTKKDAGAAVEAVFAAIEKALVKGEEVKISGFGSLVVKERKAREGVNPANGAKIQIPAAKTVALKPSKVLKEKVQ